jgi:hypothetical protein
VRPLDEVAARFAEAFEIPFEHARRVLWDLRCAHLVYHRARPVPTVHGAAYRRRQLARRQRRRNR